MTMNKLKRNGLAFGPWVLAFAIKTAMNPWWLKQASWVEVLMFGVPAGILAGFVMHITRHEA